MTAIAYLPDGRELAMGLNDDIPADLYHQLPGCSQSMLKVIRDRSPAHLKHQMDNPPRQTDAQRLGAAIHDAVLLPDAFARLWVRGPEGDARTKAVKAARAQLQADHPDATLLKPDEYDTCLAVRDAIAAHPRARALLVGDAEQSAFWEDGATGVLCRGRFDLVGRRSGALTDLKTCRAASREEFTRAIWTWGYHIQAAYYLDGARTIGLDHDRFAFVAAEKAPPYAVAVYELTVDAIEDGQRELRPLLEQYSECLANDEWPAYPEDVELIDLPVWAPGQIDRRLGEIAA